jgi:uncharacterized protein YndB with AHSA1/START domain
MNDTEPVRATVTIDATPEDVFPYLLDPALLVQWMGDTAELRPEPGGVFALDMGEILVRGTYVVVEPPRRVEFTWGVLDNDTLPPGSTTVEIVLTADGEQTIVELTHRGLPADWRTPHMGGWNARLGALAGRFGA